MIDYKTILFKYLIAVPLLLIFILKDRHTPANKSLQAQQWSLIPGIALIAIAMSNTIIQAFWNRIPVLQNYSPSTAHWLTVVFFYYTFVLGLGFASLYYVYKVSIIETFKLRLNYLPFILKICFFLLLANILSTHFLGINLLLSPPKFQIEAIKSMDLKIFLWFAFLSIFLGPIVEEVVYRGIVYSPIYRKLGKGIAVILTSMLWTYGHSQDLVGSVNIFVFGVILAWLYDRSGSLLHPIILHSFRNSWIIIYYVQK
ncbi:MAG: type II CAAX endopeptidase family protein [Thermodesulfovibrionales bacterium]